MKRIFAILTVLAATTTMSFGQISDRQNDEATYLIGARPLEGNFGFYFGLSTSDILDFENDSVEFLQYIPLLNVKYYYTDQLVLKGGVHIWKKRRSIEGELDWEENDLLLSEYKHVSTQARWKLQAGVEKHFDLSNIIDGYVGANTHIGYGRSVSVSNEAGKEYVFDPVNGLTPVDVSSENKGSSFGIIYGGDLIVGMNVFVADWPLAIGMEYGISFENHGANKFKYEYDEELADGSSSSGTYYTSMVDDFDDELANSFYDNSNYPFDDLKIRRFDIMPIGRLTLTYYLKR